jgi:hypothetical protein
MSKSKLKVGDKVTYVPNGNDYASRPKNVPMPATITGISEREQTLKNESGALYPIKRTVFNLLVLQDSSMLHVRRERVVHEDDRLPGEVYITSNEVSEKPEKVKAPKGKTAKEVKAAEGSKAE